MAIVHKNIKKILFLGYGECKLLDFLVNHHEVVQTMERLTLNEIKKVNADLIVSYGYKYILGKEITEFYPNQILNLHISYLPWNRGMYPNIWSFLDDTPKGVTIHFIDRGIDTGNILFQEEVFFDDQETLYTSYGHLRETIEDLFIKNWDTIKKGEFSPQKPFSRGTFHLKKDSEIYFKKLGILDFAGFFNWDVTVEELKKRHAAIQQEEKC